MADGFKVADAFVDVEVDLDAPAIKSAAASAGQSAGRELEREITDAGGRSGAGFGRSFDTGSSGPMRNSRGRFVRDFDGLGEKVGKSSGDRFGSRFGGGLLTGTTNAASKIGGIVTSGLTNLGPAGPVIGGVVLAAVGVAAPMAGAALGGALVAGVAAAGIGVGIAAAMRDDRVKGAVQELKGDFGDMLDGIADDWAPTVLSAIGSIRGEVGGIGEELRTALAPAKGYVQPLLDGFMSLVRGALPGFNNLLREAGPIIAVLKDGLATIGDAIGQSFSEMSGSTDEMAAGLQTILYLVADLIVIGGQVIAWLAEAYATTVDWGVSFLGWLSKIPGVGDTFKGWQEDLKQIQDTANGTGPALDSAGNSMKGLGGAAAEAGASSEAMAIRQRILNGTMSDGVDAAGDLKGALQALSGVAMSAEQAEIGFKDAVQRATSAIKDNGRNTDINTEKGRANRAALLALAQAGVQRAQAQYDQTSATKGTSAAETAAARTYANSREQLIRTARQMGMSKEEARQYANRIMAIPKSWNTSIKANNSQAKATIAETRRMLNGIPDEVVNIAMRVTGTRNASAAAAAVRKNSMATGGPVTGPGMKGVDSELRLLAPGEHVLTDKEVDAAGGHSAVMAWRAALRNGVNLSGAGAGRGPAPAATTTGGGSSVTHYNFERGAIVLDLSSFSGLTEVVEAVQGLATAARTYRVGTVFREAAA